MFARMLLVVMCGTCAAQDRPLSARLGDYKKEMDKSAAVRIVELEQEKQNLQKRLRQARSNRNSIDRKRITSDFDKAIKKIDDKIEFVKSGLNFTILDTENGNTGDIGWLDAPVMVVQVIGPTEALIDFDDTLLWLEGFSTSGIADKQRLRPSILFEIAGTKQYVSTSGAKRTVRHLRVIDWDDWKKVGGNKPAK